MKRLREVEDMVAKEGCLIEAMERSGGGHLKVRWLHPESGKRGLLVAGFSPSCGRALKNLRANLRKSLKRGN